MKICKSWQSVQLAWPGGNDDKVWLERCLSPPLACRPILRWERRHYFRNECSPTILDVETDRELGRVKNWFLRFSEVFVFCIQEGGGQKVKRDKSNLKYTESKLVKKSISKRKIYWATTNIVCFPVSGHFSLTLQQLSSLTSSEFPLKNACPAQVKSQSPMTAKINDITCGKRNMFLTKNGKSTLTSISFLIEFQHSL